MKTLSLLLLALNLPLLAVAEVVLDVDAEIEKVALAVNSWEMEESNQWTEAHRTEKITALDEYIDQVKGYRSHLTSEELRAKYHALVAGLHGYKIAHREAGLLNLLGLRNNILKAIEIENENRFSIDSPSRRMLDRSIHVLGLIRLSIPEEVDTPREIEVRDAEFDGKIKTLKDYRSRLRS